MSSKEQKQEGIVFDLFRYQLVPKSIYQLKLFGKEITEDELIKRKNELFVEAFMSHEEYFSKKKKGLAFKVEARIQDLVWMKFGIKKDVKLHDEKFEEKTEPDFPNVEIFINNKENIQGVAISRNQKAFSSSFVVAKILEENFEKMLEDYRLSFYLQPISEEKEFWQYVKRYEKRIFQLSFELIKPNLSNISEALQDELKGLITDTNSHKSKVELNAAKGGNLENISESSERVGTLVEFSLKGGGNIFVKIVGAKRRTQINKMMIKETNIDKIEFEGKPKDVIKVLEELIKF